MININKHRLWPSPDRKTSETLLGQNSQDTFALEHGCLWD